MHVMLTNLRRAPCDPGPVAPASSRFSGFRVVGSSQLSVRSLVSARLLPLARFQMAASAIRGHVVPVSGTHVGARTWNAALELGTRNPEPGTRTWNPNRHLEPGTRTGNPNQDEPPNPRTSEPPNRSLVAVAEF